MSMKCIPLFAHFHAVKLWCTLHSGVHFFLIFDPKYSLEFGVAVLMCSHNLHVIEKNRKVSIFTASVYFVGIFVSIQLLLLG